METIRILLVAMPQLMSDIVEVGLSTEPDIEVGGVLHSLSALAGAAPQTNADFLVVGVEGTQLPEECRTLLADRPQLRVLMVEHVAVEAWLYELRPHRVSLGALTPAHLVAVIRSTARASARPWELC